MDDARERRARVEVRLVDTDADAYTAHGIDLGGPEGQTFVEQLHEAAKECMDVAMDADTRPISELAETRVLVLEQRVEEIQERSNELLRELELLRETGLPAPEPCQRAADELEKSREEKRELQTNVIHLLNQVGDRGACKKCPKEIWWVRMRSGRTAPYTADALNHFADCPHADEFRKGGGS